MKTCIYFPRGSQVATMHGTEEQIISTLEAGNQSPYGSVSTISVRRELDRVLVYRQLRPGEARDYAGEQFRAEYGTIFPERGSA